MYYGRAFLQMSLEEIEGEIPGWIMPAEKTWDHYGPLVEDTRQLSWRLSEAETEGGCYRETLQQTRGLYYTRAFLDSSVTTVTSVIYVRI